MNMSNKAKKLAAAIKNEVDKMWVDEPVETKKLRLGLLESRAGSYHQCFSTLVFADGETRALGYIVLSGSMKAVQNPKFSLEQIRELIRILLPISIEYLGYSGFPKIREFGRDFLSILDEIDSREEFEEILANFTLYANLFHGWIHLYFPWFLGEFFPLRNKDNLEDMLRLLRS
jgi:hypothetical protein